MLATLLVVFREIIEASLVVSIVLAATRGVPGRGIWVGGGVLAGIAGACLVAGATDALGGLLSGGGQEWFNVAVLCLAVVMLAWHNVWMARHGRALARDIKAVGAEVSSGRRPLLALSMVVGLAILREGSEIVLFLYGIFAAGGASTGSMALGALGGSLLGIAAAAGMYFGLLRIPAHRLFAVTSALITLLAAGMAAQAAGFLAQLDAVSAFSARAWNSSALLSEESIVGRMLHGLMGYSDHPSWLQVLVYGATALAIYALMRLVGTGRNPSAA